MPTVSEKTKAVLGLLLCVLFWSINAAIARSFAIEIPPIIMSLYRWGGAGVIILPLVIRDWREALYWLKKMSWQILLLSFLSVTIYNTLQYKAGETTESININLFVTMCPMLTFILAFLINRDKMTMQGLWGLLLAIIGTLVVIGKGKMENILSLTFVEGDLIMIVAITAWGLYTVLLRRYKIQCKPLVLLALLIWLGFLMLLVIYFVFPVNDVYTLKPSHFYVYAYLWIFPTIFSVSFWMYSVKILGPGSTAFGLYSAPIYGAFIGFFFLNEQLYRYHFIGGLLILLGFYLNFKKKNRS